MKGYPDRDLAELVKRGRTHIRLRKREGNDTTNQRRLSSGEVEYLRWLAEPDATASDEDRGDR